MSQTCTQTDEQQPGEDAGGLAFLSENLRAQLFLLHRL